MRRGVILGSQYFAGAVEAAARLDHQVDGMHIALDASSGDYFQAIGRDRALHTAADDDGGSLDPALEVAVGTNNHVGFGLNVAVDAPVEVQRIAQGEIADKLGACRDDG